MVDRIDDVDNGVAVAVVLRPNGPDPALASEIPELEHGRRQGYLPGCMKCVHVCVGGCMTYNEEAVSIERGRSGGYCVLFWPTVGAILSGGRPGVSLYIVLIFSRRVCKNERE